MIQSVPTLPFLEIDLSSLAVEDILSVMCLTPLFNLIGWVPYVSRCEQDNYWKSGEA